MVKQTFNKTNDYHIEWHVAGDQFHIHCTVDHWSKSVLSALYLEFTRLRVFVKDMGYSYFYSISPNPKFCELFGGESIGEQNGKEVMMWVI